MDLHFTDATANHDERDAVDALLGLPGARWTGGERDERSSRQSVGGHEARRRRDLLLPVLHAVQDRIGWISPGALNYLCSRLSIPPAEAYGVATFYALLSTKPQPPTVVHVCDDIACRTQGAERICARLEAEFAPAGVCLDSANAMWKRSPCLGLCEKAPAVFVQCAGINTHDYTVAPADASAVLNLAGEPPSTSTCIKRVPGGSVPQSLGRTLLKRVGTTDPSSLEAYLAQGGYDGLRRAIEVGPESVISELEAAKLSGRGGAAFPTHVKWKAVANAPAMPHYIVCNADESEPGTFKDRVLMEEDPFAVIESITIAGYVCGAASGYLYIRGEYPEATRILEEAMRQARGKSFLGSGILGAAFDFDIEIRRGGGAYICGEETALLESIEGKRGEPRNKPPFPVTVGLFGKPTAINNVETLVNVLPILASGGSHFAEIGTSGSSGTRLFCLSGCIQRPGVYEAPYGETLGDLIERAGGVPEGRTLQAVLLGGAAGVFVRPDELAMPLTLEGARAANATLGSGVIMVFDDTVDLKAILVRIAEFFRDESCGQCVPCRVGTVRQEEALQRLLANKGDAGQDTALLGELDRAMKDASICGLGHTASTAILSAIHRLGVFHGAVN